VDKGGQTEEQLHKSWWAGFVSYVLHPLFIPSLITAYLLFIHPVNKLLISPEGAMRAWISVTLNTVLYPAFLVFLLWRLKFVSSMHLKNQRERIIPLVVNIMFYFWAWYVSRNIELFPVSLKLWLMGAFLCSCAAMFTNIFMKMSLHGIGWGGAVGFCIIQQGIDPNFAPIMLPLVLVLAGLAGTARLVLHAHKPGEVYAGYLAGMICLFGAWGLYAVGVGQPLG